MKTLLSLIIGLLLCLTAKADVVLGNITLHDTDCEVMKSGTNTIKCYFVSSNSTLCVTASWMTNVEVWITNVVITSTNVLIHIPEDPPIPDALKPLNLNDWSPRVDFTNGSPPDVIFMSENLLVVLTSPYNTDYNPYTAMIVAMVWKPDIEKWVGITLGRLLPPED